MSQFYPPVSQACAPIAGYTAGGCPVCNLNRLLIFVILFVLLQLAVLVIKPFTKAANHVPVVSGINRLLGAALGALQAVLLMVLAAMVCRLPFWKTGNEIASASLLRYSDG